MSSDVDPAPAPLSPRDDGASSRFSPDLMYAAAQMYYLQDATQAQVSARLGTSRATVSRLLSEARRQGIVRIEVVPPATADDGDVAARLAAALGLRGVHLGSDSRGERGPDLGVTLGPVVARVLASTGLQPGDVLLVSSGRSTYEVSQAELPHLPGVRVAPTVGGTDQVDAWYQTNEATRRVAERLGATPLFLFAPALPGQGLYEELLDDPGTRRVLTAWDEARVAIVGVGAPPRTRTSLASFVDRGDPVLMGASGDVCNRFFDEEGRPVPFRGAERLVATTLEHLRRLERCIAVAVGSEKVPSLLAAARAGLITDLVTDPPTARALLAAAHASSG
ncbi:sugar-binding domain-containing protein [Pseudokineococcus basanitobsidens]|uniref:Sugar-binding domain-containing protein n=1 Tax=Pseudokineococcus basanitobsidens TaxID=1926649 RepID=A0ABU8RJM2_9ACTN